MEDQRKRTLDALERRFAQAEAEVRTQDQHSKKKRVENKGKFNPKTESSSASPSAHSAVKKPISTAPSRKGNISFSERTTRQDEVNQPAYFNLLHSVDNNLLPPSGAEITDRKTVVDSLLHKLFEHGDSARKYMQGSKSMKIESTILLDNFVPKSSMAVARSQALENFSKRSKKRMSLKQHKRMGSFDLPQEYHDYEIFKPLNEKWKSYALQLLKMTGRDQLNQCFLNADLHGASILVVQSKVASYTGIRGIMVRETKETFGIITQHNKFRVVPKKLCVFMMQVECWKITLHGDKLTSRNLVP